MANKICPQMVLPILPTAKSHKRKPVALKFRPITKGGNGWHTHPQVGRTEIGAGPYNVQWPDGTIETVQIGIMTHRYEVSDHGHPYMCTDKIAVVQIVHKGARMTVNCMEAKLKLAL